MPLGIKTELLSIARVSWGLTVHVPAAKTGSFVRNGKDAFRGKQKVLSVPTDTPTDALDWLILQLNGLPAGTTIESAEHEGLKVPATSNEAVKAFAEITKNEVIVASHLDEIAKAKRNISEKLSELFDSVSHPPIK